jgi:hypothetical protein
MRRNADQALLDDKPWGYDVTIYFNNAMQPKTFHKQGTRAAVERWARLKANHDRHEIGESYTRRQWLNCFGDGRDRM